MTKTCLIASGVPGCGKSTWIRREVAELIRRLQLADDDNGDDPSEEFSVPEWDDKYSHVFYSAGPFCGRVVSADYSMIDAEGRYAFDKDKLNKCHGDCAREFVAAVVANISVLGVDNTNLGAWEIAFYYRLAEIYGYDVKVARFVGDPAKAAARNVHGVPLDKVLAMHNRTEPLPPHWNVEYVAF